MPEVPTGLALASVVLAGLITLLTCAAAGLAFPVAASLRDLGPAVTVESVTPWSIAQLLVLGLTLPLWLAAYIVTCLWLRRSREHLEAARPGFRHRRGGVWVWLGWFVPVVSFWFPRQVVEDIRWGNDAYAPNALNLWWGAWIVALGFGEWADRAAPGDPAGPGLEVAAAGLLVVCLACWAHVVRSTTAAQRVLTSAAVERTQTS